MTSCWYDGHRWNLTIFYLYGPMHMSTLTAWWIIWSWVGARKSHNRSWVATLCSYIPSFVGKEKRIKIEGTHTWCIQDRSNNRNGLCSRQIKIRAPNEFDGDSNEPWSNKPEKNTVKEAKSATSTLAMLTIYWKNLTRLQDHRSREKVLKAFYTCTKNKEWLWFWRNQLHSLHTRSWYESTS